MANKPKLKIVGGDAGAGAKAPEGGWYGEDWRVATGNTHLSDNWFHGDIYQPDSRPKKPE